MSVQSKEIDGEELRELSKDLQNTIAAMRIEAPFFTHLVTGAIIKFRRLPDGIPALSRGRRTIVIDPDKFRKMKPGPRLTMLAHEAIHHSLYHLARGKGRDRAKWQAAADVADNSLLDAGNLLYTPPEPTFTAEWVKSLGIQIPKEDVEKLSAEAIYEILPPIPSIEVPCFLDGDEGDDEDEGDRGEEEGAGDPEQYWRERIAAASVIAKQAGKLPAGLEWFVKEYLKVRTPWWAILRGAFNNGYSSAKPTWKTLSRRYGDSYPGTTYRGPSTLCLVDSSGSIFDDEQKAFCGHLERIVRDTMGELTYLMWDSTAYKMVPFRRGQKVRFSGGGGTTVQPVLQTAMKLSGRFDCLVVLTDFYISDADDDATRNLFRALVSKYDICVLASIGAQAQLPSGWRVLDIRDSLKEGMR